MGIRDKLRNYNPGDSASNPASRDDDDGSSSSSSGGGSSSSGGGSGGGSSGGSDGESHEDVLKRAEKAGMSGSPVEDATLDAADAGDMDKVASASAEMSDDPISQSNPEFRDYQESVEESPGSASGGSSGGGSNSPDGNDDSGSTNPTRNYEEAVKQTPGGETTEGPPKPSNEDYYTSGRGPAPEDSTQSEQNETSDVSAEVDRALTGLGFEQNADGDYIAPDAAGTDTLQEQRQEEKVDRALAGLGYEETPDGYVAPDAPGSETLREQRQKQKTDRALSGLGFEETAQGDYRAPTSGETTFREAQVRNQVRDKLESEIKEQRGVSLDLGPGDVAYSSMTEGGKTFVIGELSDSGREQLKVEQTPFKDTPLVGGVLTTGSRVDAAYSNARRDNRERLNNALDGVPGAKEAQALRRQTYEMTDDATESAVNTGLDWVKSTGGIGSRVAGAGLILGTIAEDAAPVGGGVANDLPTIGAGLALLAGTTTVADELNENKKAKKRFVDEAGDSVAAGVTPFAGKAGLVGSPDDPTTAREAYPDELTAPENPSNSGTSEVGMPDPSANGGTFGPNGVPVPSNGGPFSSELGVSSGTVTSGGEVDAPTNTRRDPSVLEAQRLIEMDPEQIGKERGRGSTGGKNQNLPDEMIPDREVIIGRDPGGGTESDQPDYTGGESGFRERGDVSNDPVLNEAKDGYLNADEEGLGQSQEFGIDVGVGGRAGQRPLGQLGTDSDSALTEDQQSWLMDLQRPDTATDVGLSQSSDTRSETLPENAYDFAVWSSEDAGASSVFDYSRGRRRGRDRSPDSSSPSSRDSGFGVEGVGAGGDDVLAPGWLAETFTAYGTSGFALENLSQSQLRERAEKQGPGGMGEIPTYQMVFGDAETKESIDDARQLFSGGGIGVDVGVGMDSSSDDGDGGFSLL